MTQPCLVFSDLTLGYGRHPAVHHLSGTVATGSLTAVVGANGSGKSTLMKGIVGVLKPMDGNIVNARNARIAYLPQQSELDRTFPARVVDLVSLGVWPKRGLLGRFTDEDRASISKALSAVGLEGFEKRPIDTLSGGQLQRDAVRARAGAGRRDHPARRAVQRDGRQDRRRPDRADQALARREPHGHGRRPRPQPGARAFPGDAAAGPPAGGLGRHDRDAAAGEPAARAALRRGLARRCAVVRARRRSARARACAWARPRPSSPPPDHIKRRDRHVRLSDRALRRIRLHAARAAGLADAVAERLPGRRVPDAAPHEPDRRRHGARDPAGRGGRLPALRAGDHPDDHRRPCRRRHRRDGRRLRLALHGAEGGRLDGRLLPDLACASAC